MSRAAPPLYYRSAPSIWFSQLESFFKLNKIEDADRYHIVVSALPEDIAVRTIETKDQDYDNL